MAGLFLGIDVGTGGVRACAIDTRGAIKGMESVALPPPRQDGNAIDQDPELWWQATLAAIGKLGDKINLANIERVSVDGTSGTLLLIDADGRPRTPGLMYNDARATMEASRIAAVAPAESGAHGASSALAKLLYLLNQGTDGARFAVHQADWIAGRLAGQHGVSDENNTLKLGYDPVTRTWPDWLDRLDLPRDLLPKVLVPGTEFAGIDPTIAATLGLPTSARIAVGTTDGVAAFIATRADTPGDAVTSLGTTLVVKLLATQPIFAASQGVYSHRLGDSWLAGGASNTGGGALLAHFSATEMERLTPQLRPEAPTGLDFYPLAKPGERFPIADPAMPPRVTPRPAEDHRFFQALLEGIASVEALAYRQLSQLGAPPLRRVISIGGGARNAAWTEIRHRALGVPVTVAEQTEASYGAALLALRGGPGMTQATIEIEGLRSIADRFDHVLLDQWGTLHEGQSIFPAALDCVARLREAGKRVLVLSNSGKRSDSNARRLAALGLPPAAYDGILTSGEATWIGLRTRAHAPFNALGYRCFLITRGGDRTIVDGLDLAVVDEIERSDFILLAGLDDAAAEPEQWRQRLAGAAARGVPMLCANPDLTMFGADGLIPAPGALARCYEGLGGRVTFVGKPHAPIFAAALAQLGQPAPARVLMVGDSLDHDIAGGSAAGMLTLFLRAGVHRDDAVHSPEAMAGEAIRTPHWTMTHLLW